jgi:hypothetical protein
VGANVLVQPLKRAHVPRSVCHRPAA